ncbi:MAG: hypothetical protein MJA29_01130, partial [Candidatus Omnitrophica bacterium]|nr:hypothetical protein [Candidatus Omnitrophota bacterium]
NFFSLLYQLLIAHKLPVADFAAFNSLIAIFTMASAPLYTLQVAVTKYVSEFNAQGRGLMLRGWLSGLLRKNILYAGATLLTAGFLSSFILDALKIPAASCGYILALLLAVNWFFPVFAGAVQGLERFGWYSGVSVAGGILKLGLAALLIALGYSAQGALGALLAANAVTVLILCVPLRPFLSFGEKGVFRYRDVFSYLVPVALSYFCFMALVSTDMIMVRYFFSENDSGFYSLAQIIGKIFLFLPGAVSMVMFPRTSSLKAQNRDTRSTLNRSLRYVFWLCVAAGIVYNLFPARIFTVLAGKVYPESIILGRFFAVSMSFYTLAYVVIAYFLSIKETRFVRFLMASTVIQVAAFAVFHRSLMHIQLIMCVNAAGLFTVLMALLGRKGPPGAQEA